MKKLIEKMEWLLEFCVGCRSREYIRASAWQGNVHMLEEEHIAIEGMLNVQTYQEKGYTVVYVAVDRTFAGIYYLVTEKEDAESKKIYTIVTITGAIVLVGSVVTLLV